MKITSLYSTVIKAMCLLVVVLIAYQVVRIGEAPLHPPSVFSKMKIEVPIELNTAPIQMTRHTAQRINREEPGKFTGQWDEFSKRSFLRNPECRGDC